MPEPVLHFTAEYAVEASQSLSGHVILCQRKIRGNMDTHYLLFFLGTFHGFTISNIEGGERWLCHAANMS